MHTFVKVIVALLWAFLLFAFATVGEQFIKMWLWKSHGICPVCSRRDRSVNAEDAQLV